MKKLLLLSIVVLFSCVVVAQNDAVKSTFTSPLWSGADPWIIKHKDKYYTVRSDKGGLVVTESPFMTRIEREELVWQPPKNAWNSFNIWAPELHYIKGKWYIYYAAAPVNGSPFFRQKTGVLESKSPFGPYEDKGMVITSDTPDDPSSAVWAIDMSPFEFNGKWYALWSGWEKNTNTDQTAQHTYIAEMINPWTLGPRQLISKAEEAWELGEAFGLQEGQSALKNGKDLFIVYSTRGSWTIYYRIGYLKLKQGADPLQASSWVKSEGPVFVGNDNVHGVGHSSYTVSPDGKENWVYYHSKKGLNSGWDRDVRLQPFTFDKDGNPYFGDPVTGELKRPSGEVEVENKILKKKK